MDLFGVWWDEGGSYDGRSSCGGPGDSISMAVPRLWDFWGRGDSYIFVSVLRDLGQYAR